MPNLEEHCKRTLKRYGVEGRDIHSWLDEPSKEYATTHRQFRHDTETIRMVGEIFGKTYGKSLAENIALDHIMLDHEEEIKKHTIVVKLPEKEEIPTIPCSYCNTLLRPSDQFCPKCGASRTKIIEEFDRAYEIEKLKLQEKKKNLQRELKLELALRELTPEERAYLWKYADRSYSVNLNAVIAYGDSEDIRASLSSESEGLKGPSHDQTEALEKKGLSKPFGKAVLDRLAQEDFERHPDLKEQVYREIESARSRAEKVKEKKRTRLPDRLRALFQRKQ